jgi:hypothetical protein
MYQHKVDVCYLNIFLSASTSRRIHNTSRLVQDDQQIQNVPIAICLIKFRAHMNILFIGKVKILMLTNWSYRYPNHVDDY